MLSTRLVVSLAVVTAALPLAVTSAQAQSRQQIWAAGSSTVFPYVARAAEVYANKRKARTPKVESLGTGGGIKLFCSGVGAAYPDVANASRPMKASEFDACAKNGVRDIVEIKIGYDGIVVASDKKGPSYNLLREHLWLGLAADVLRGGKLVPNPYKTWPEIARGLPRGPIRVYGPPPTSGTRDAFNELALEEGAEAFPTMARLKKTNEKAFKGRAGSIRQDGAWIDAGENDNAIVGTLTKTPGSLGVFGYSFLAENPDKVKAATIGGVAPNPRSIADGSYPLSRSLYIYVKKAHVRVTPGLALFVKEITSDAAAGRGGYLADRGLIVLPTSQHEANKLVARDMPSMPRPTS